MKILKTPCNNPFTQFVPKERNLFSSDSKGRATAKKAEAVSVFYI